MPKVIEQSLIENIQKKDLDPIDRANAVKTLVDSEKKKWKSMRDAVAATAKKIGRSKSMIWDDLAIIGLKKEVKKKISEGKIRSEWSYLWRY
jgi:ParB family chromosome partitioning protein